MSKCCEEIIWIILQNRNKNFSVSKIILETLYMFMKNLFYRLLKYVSTVYLFYRNNLIW